VLELSNWDILIPRDRRDQIGRTGMRVFVAACAAAVVGAAVGAFALNIYQEPASTAFATEAVRI
jgi:hypothetical protein